VFSTRGPAGTERWPAAALGMGRQEFQPGCEAINTHPGGQRQEVGGRSNVTDSDVGGPYSAGVHPWSRITGG
jgi:hypothetical protein